MSAADPLPSPARRRRPRLLVVVLACLAGVLVVVSQLALDSSGALTGSVTNSDDSASSLAYFTCRSAVVGATGTTAYFAYPLADPVLSVTATDVSGNARPGAYSLTGVTYGQADPCPRDTPASTAVSLNGTSGAIAGPNSTQANPTVFSVEIWFLTSTAAGKLIGFGSSRTGSSGSYDRHLYVDSTGKLEFGVYPNSAKTVASPGVVTDGRWHHAVGTLSSAGPMLYLDGVLVASDATVTTAQNFTGYWRIGYDNIAGWPSSPSSGYVNGRLAWASVYTYALTAAQVRGHYTAGL